MKSLKEYVVRFSELMEEVEMYEFLLGDSFFKVFNNEVWENGSIHVIVKASKRSDGITFDFDLQGDLLVSCDRCLETFPYHVAAEQRLFLKYGQEDANIDDDVVIVPREENQIDLTVYLYEYLVLSVPVKKVHPDDAKGNSGCDKKMIEILQEHIISEEKVDTDPRWDDLKKLLDKN